ncbi:MAG: DUF5658 family protein [Gammaproteobacteria bacterium]
MTLFQMLSTQLHYIGRSLPMLFSRLRGSHLPDCPIILRNWLIARDIDPKRFKYFANTLLILLFALLHTADGIITYLGLRFDYVDEANPLLLFFAGTMGLGLSIFALKLLCLEFIAVLFFARRKMGSCWGTATLVGADAFYSWVVSNNILLVAAAA